MMKNHRKSVRIWQSYGREFSGLLFWPTLYEYVICVCIKSRREDFDADSTITPLYYPNPGKNSHIACFLKVR